MKNLLLCLLFYLVITSNCLNTLKQESKYLLEEAKSDEKKDENFETKLNRNKLINNSFSENSNNSRWNEFYLKSNFDLNKKNEIKLFKTPSSLDFNKVEDLGKLNLWIEDKNIQHLSDRQLFNRELNSKSSSNLIPAQIIELNLKKTPPSILIPDSPLYLISDVTNYTKSISILNTTSSTDPKQNKTFQNLNYDKIQFDLKSNWKFENKLGKNCLSNLDCNLKLNERCLSFENEEYIFYSNLKKIQKNQIEIYSIYFNKLKKLHYNQAKPQNESYQTNANAFNKMNLDYDQISNSYCGCTAPAFARNINTGQCEVLRLVELDFRLRLVNLNYFNLSSNLEFIHNTIEYESNSFQLVDSKTGKKFNQDIFNQIGQVIRNSETLTNIVHHLRLSEIIPIRKNNHLNQSNRNYDLFQVKILMMMFSSEYTPNFDLLFTNEYCITLNNIRLKAQNNFFKQQLSLYANRKQTRSIQSDKSPNLKLISNLVNKTNITNTFLFKHNLNKLIWKSKNSLIIQTYLNQTKSNKKKEFYSKKPKRSASNRIGLDIQLSQVQSYFLNICLLNLQYSQNKARYIRSQVNQTKEFINSFKPQSKYDQLIYCNNDRSYCKHLPQTQIGYVCTCHSNLMDLSPSKTTLPGEYCGVRCPDNYCTNGGYCHVTDSAGEPVDHDLAAQQSYLLSTSSRSNKMLNLKRLDLDEMESISNHKDESSLSLNQDNSNEKKNFQYTLNTIRRNRQKLQQYYYAAIYSVQLRFAKIFNYYLEDEKKSGKISNNKHAYAYAYTSHLVTFYCTCPRWQIGSRCQYSSFMMLCVLGILVLLFALITIIAITMLCMPPGKNKHKLHTNSNISNIHNLLDVSKQTSCSRLNSKKLQHQAYRKTKEIRLNTSKSKKSLNSQLQNKTKISDSSVFNYCKLNPISQYSSNKIIEKNLSQKNYSKYNTNSSNQPILNLIQTESQYLKTFASESEENNYVNHNQFSTYMPNQSKLQPISNIDFYLNETHSKSKNNNDLDENNNLNHSNKQIFSNSLEKNKTHFYEKIKFPNEKESLTLKSGSNYHVHNIYSSSGELRINLEPESRSFASQTSEFNSLGSTSLPQFTPIYFKKNIQKPFQ